MNPKNFSSYCTKMLGLLCAICLDFFSVGAIIEPSNEREERTKMMREFYMDLEKQLLKEIEETKGFSFKKMLKIAELSQLLTALKY